MWGKIREVREVREKLRDKCPRSYGKKLFLVFLSLIRTSDLSVEGTHKQQSKEKSIFLLYFSRLFVPLHNVCF